MSVFDTSAVLAIIYDEEGRGAAETQLAGSVISTINVAEVAGDLIITGKVDSEIAVRLIAELGLTISPPSLDQAKRAAELHRIPRLSLGDRFCIALGEALNEPLITGDQQWARVPDIRVPVELIR